MAHAWYRAVVSHVHVSLVLDDVGPFRHRDAAVRTLLELALLEHPVEDVIGNLIVTGLILYFLQLSLQSLDLLVLLDVDSLG